MKTIIVLFTLLCSMNTFAQGTRDAARHLGAGVVIGGVGGYAAYKLSNGQRGWTWAGAVGSSLAASLAKETLYDVPRGFEFESRDVLFTTLGGVLSGLALELIYKNTYRRGGGRRGKNCGCLVVDLDVRDTTNLPLITVDGSGDISSAIQVAYLLK